jgi:hypothetical protein
MKYKFESSIMIAAFLVLSAAGIASADSVIKTLYVDGVKVGQASANQALSYPFQRLVLGAEGAGWYRYNGLVGEMDEFALFDGVLPDANIAALYDANSAGCVAAVTTNHPILYLRFEDAGSSNGSKAADQISTDTNATYVGSVGLDANATAFLGKSVILHGAADGTGDCIDVCDWDGRFYKSNITVAFWVKTTQTNEYPRFFQHNGGTAEQRSYGAMSIVDTCAVGLIGGGSTSYITRKINDGYWHNVVVTFASIHPGPYAVEVLADDPCVYLKFDNTMLVDSSVNGYVVARGADTNVVKAPGGIGKSLWILNASNHACAYVWNNWWLDPEGHRNREDITWAITPTRNDYYAFAASDITFEIWIKSVPGMTPGQYAALFSQIGQWTNEPNGPFLGISGNTQGASTFRVGAGSQWWWTGVNTPLDNQWHQIVVTYDENENSEVVWGKVGHDMTLQLYVDGAMRALTTVVDDGNVPGRAKLGPELSHLMIGSENDRGYAYNTWAGYIDEVAIYGGILSADRIAMHFAAWQPKDCAEVWARGMGLAGDLDMDCDVDLFDYASFASQWAQCNTPGGAGCTQNW